MEELKRLKMKFTPHWTEENVEFLLQLYKDSQRRSASQLVAQAHNDVNKLKRRQHLLTLKNRFQTGNSVAQQSTSNMKAYNYFQTMYS